MSKNILVIFKNGYYKERLEEGFKIGFYRTKEEGKNVIKTDHGRYPFGKKLSPEKTKKFSRKKERLTPYEIKNNGKQKVKIFVRKSKNPVEVSDNYIKNDSLELELNTGEEIPLSIAGFKFCSLTITSDKSNNVRIG